MARENWASKLGFILAAAGSAVGLGNIWRFPYIVGEQGGAIFVLIYLVLIFLVGYPVMVTEAAIGRKSRKSPVGAFKALAPNTPWWIVGTIGVLAGFIILSFYSVVAGWSFSYIFQTALGNLGPEVDHEAAFYGFILDTWTPLFWHLVAMVLTVGIIAGGVVKGIQRWVSILWPVMGVLIVVLVVRAITLEGAGAGIDFYLRPDITAVTWATLHAALGQVFFTLSLGMGVLITYGSYLSSKDEIPGSCTSIVGMDTGVALIAGFAIFPAVFHFGLDPGEGPGLAFVTIPAVFAEMPFGGAFFGALFFLLLSVAALTSMISLLEVVAAWLIDEKGWHRPKAAAFMGAIIFVVGIFASLSLGDLSHIQIPYIGVFFDLLEYVGEALFLPLGSLLTVIFAGYVWGAHKIKEEANLEAKGIRIGGWYDILIRYVVPVAVAIILVMGTLQTFEII